MGTEQVWQALGGLFAVDLYAEKDAPIAEYVITLFCDRGAAVPLLSGVWYLQLVLETNHKLRSSRFRNIRELTPSETIIILHSLIVLDCPIKRKDRRMTQVYTTRTVIALCVQLVFKAWRLQFEMAVLHFCSNAIAPYMWYDESQNRFLILSKPSQRISSLQWRTSLIRVGLHQPRQRVLIRKPLICQLQLTMLRYTLPTFWSKIFISSSLFRIYALRVQKGTSWQNTSGTVTHFRLFSAIYCSLWQQC